MAYADGIVIIGSSLESMKESFQLLEEASKEVGLDINEGKTKYMVAVNTQNCSKPCSIEIGRYNFERVDRFMYLGIISSTNFNAQFSLFFKNMFVAVLSATCFEH